MEITDKEGRRRIIHEVVDRWVKKNPDLVRTFAAAVKEMRQGCPSENRAMAYKATVPGDLFRQLDFALSSDGDVRLFDPEGELQWFINKYPEFSVPYDRSTLER